MASDSGITLNYWPGRGLMEVSRCCLAIADKTYTDIQGVDWHEKGSLMDSNLGRVPLLSCEAGSIGQSNAINFYVASECGLMGSTTFEAAQIINFTEHINELNIAFRKAYPYGSEPDEEKIADFFENTNASDFSGPAVRDTMADRKFMWFIGRMEGIVGDGFAVGGKLSLADVRLFNMLADSLPADTHGEMPAHKREPLTSAAKVEAALASFPKVRACIASVSDHPGIVAWMEKRGPQGF